MPVALDVVDDRSHIVPVEVRGVGLVRDVGLSAVRDSLLGCDDEEDGQEASGLGIPIR